MANQSVRQPFPVFTDTDGSPLNDGYIYIGTENLAPESNLINIYWDEDSLLPAANPARTVNGYPSNGGTPGDLYASSAYSILVKNKNGVVVHSSLSPTLKLPTASINYDPELSIAGPTKVSVARSLDSRLLDHISVKDFGAVGTGDETEKIDNAFQYLAENGGALFFPPGVYKISTGIAKTLTGDVKIYGDGATIEVDGANITGIKLTTSTNNVHVEGLTFDGKASGSRLLEIYESSQTDNYIKIIDCKFFNAYSTTSDSMGCFVYGGPRKVEVTRCNFEKIERASGLNKITAGLFIDDSGGAIEPRNIAITDCHFENITNNEAAPAATNIDCDAINVQNLANASDWRLGVAVIKGCTFKNIKGRSIKSQIDKTSIDDCHVYRNISCIANVVGQGTADFNQQVSACQITNCTFNYEDSTVGEETLANPIKPISFYTGSDPSRTCMWNVDNIHVYSSVANAGWNGATPGELVHIVEGTPGGSWNVDKILNVSNVICEAPVESIIGWPTSGLTNKTYVNLSNAYVESVRFSAGEVSQAGSEGFANDFFTMTNVVNAGTDCYTTHTNVSEPAAMVYADIRVKMSGCHGFWDVQDTGGIFGATDTTSNHKHRGFPSWGLTAKTVDTALKLKEDASPVGVKCFHVELANAGEAFIQGDKSNGTAMFAVYTDISGDPNACGIFLMDNSGAGVITRLVDVDTDSGGAADRIAINSSVTATKLNLSENGDGQLKIVNLLGTTQNIHIVSFGGF